MRIADMPQKIVPSRGAFELAVGPFTVEFRVDPSAVLRSVSVKVGLQSEPYGAVATEIWLCVSFTMATDKKLSA